VKAASLAVIMFIINIASKYAFSVSVLFLIKQHDDHGEEVLGGELLAVGEIQ